MSRNSRSIAQLGQPRFRLVRRGRLADDRDVRMGLEQAPQFLPRQPLVVDDERVHRDPPPAERAAPARCLPTSRERQRCGVAVDEIADAPSRSPGRDRLAREAARSRPVFATRISTRPSARGPPSARTPPAGSSAMPCLMALSTSVWISIGGIARRAAPPDRRHARRAAVPRTGPARGRGTRPRCAAPSASVTVSRGRRRASSAAAPPAP